MKRSLPTFYTERQMIALATAPDPGSPTGLRDRAIIGLMCATGLRASEICGLKVGDLATTTVFVRQGKFGAQRFVPVSTRARQAVLTYLDRHPATAGQPLFRSLSGRAISRRHLHKIVTGYSRPLGLRGGLHILRHSFATRALNRGVNLQSVRVMLGHLHIATTSRYLWVALDALVGEYKRCLEGGPREGVAA